MRLLIVDDEAPYAQLVRSAVAEIGWETDVAARLHDGMAMIDQAQISDRPYDAVMLDLGLKDSIRYETIARLSEIRRKIKIRPETRFIVASGWMPPGEIPEGACDVVLEKHTKFFLEPVLAAITGKPV